MNTASHAPLSALKSRMAKLHGHKTATAASGHTPGDRHAHRPDSEAEARAGASSSSFC